MVQPQGWRGMVQGQMSYQKVIYVLNLGRDPELRYMPNGTGVCNFNGASTRKKANGDKETTWLRVSVFGKQAEACNQYLRVGSKVLVEGRLNPDVSTGGPRVFQRQDGSHGASYEVIADWVEFLDSRGSQLDGLSGSDDLPANAHPVDDDIPF